MAKRTKPRMRVKRERRIVAKEELEFFVRTYVEVFKEAVPKLRPQGHPVVKGVPWTKHQALQVAYFFMNTAVVLFDKNPDDALEFYYIARGIAMSQGEMPKESLLPEPTVLYTPKKPS